MAQRAGDDLVFVSGHDFGHYGLQDAQGGIALAAPPPWRSAALKGARKRLAQRPKAQPRGP